MSRKSKDEGREPGNSPNHSSALRPSPLALAFALVFGLFLGLCIWKFGNPVILDQKISPPQTASDFLADAWPTHWANWIFWPLAMAGIVLAFAKNPHRRWPAAFWLWLLPVLWFGWQLLSATQTVDADLTTATLCQFAGCVMCYFLGAFFFRARNVLLAGILAAFAFCLVRAVDQKFIEFPHTQQMLADMSQNGWTNTPPEMIDQMKRDSVIINTNGVDIINPTVLAKFSKGRVMGTLIYPNALAGLVLLLLPVSLVLARSAKLRPPIRIVAMTMTVALGVAAFYGSGSKAAWLIAIAVGGICLLRLDWPVRFKWTAIVLVTVVGLGIFAVRFHDYFARGATSVGARFDYWRAAVQTTAEHPLAGTGPGTFQNPYGRIKPPDAEMARLTHNDYLEQFSDSGIPGGILYVGWIVSAMVALGRGAWIRGDAMSRALFLGLSGWFLQGVGEFSLYIPALAWTAFALLGCLVAGNQIDKKAASS